MIFILFFYNFTILHDICIQKKENFELSVDAINYRKKKFPSFAAALLDTVEISGNAISGDPHVSGGFCTYS